MKLCAMCATKKGVGQLRVIFEFAPGKQDELVLNCCPTCHKILLKTIYTGLAEDMPNEEVNDE